MQMSFGLAMDTQRRYVCARCWGPLIVLPGEDRLTQVVCANPTRCDGKGFVTRKYAERRREESIAEFWEVRSNYPNLVQRPMKPAAQLLAELGYQGGI